MLFGLFSKKIDVYMKAKYGMIGGSGVYQIDGVRVIDEIQVETPFGNPSDEIIIANIEGENVAFLPRHGVGHRISPTELPVKANIWALKSLGVEKIISISAVGSLKEELTPKDFVIPDQIIDRTRNRDSSFFEDGIVGHIGFAEPFCMDLSKALIEAAMLSKVKVHQKETLICMEGPAFSTKAESNLYRSWGAGIIGMTALPEAKLAREAEICYATIAMVTDYDCWREEEEAVTVEMVLKTMKTNVENAKKMIPDIIKILKNQPTDCSCGNAAQCAIMTSPDIIPEETKRKLELFYGKYWNS